MIALPQSSTHSLLIPTLDCTPIDRGDGDLLHVLSALRPLKGTLLGESEVGFIGFSKVKIGEGGSKVLGQHNGLLFHRVR